MKNQHEQINRIKNIYQNLQEEEYYERNRSPEEEEFYRINPQEEPIYLFSDEEPLRDLSDEEIIEKKDFIEGYLRIANAFYNQIESLKDIQKLYKFFREKIQEK